MKIHYTTRFRSAYRIGFKFQHTLLKRGGWLVFKFGKHTLQLKWGQPIEH